MGSFTEAIYLDRNRICFFARKSAKNSFFDYARSLEASRMGLRKLKENSPDTFLLLGIVVTAQQ